jgi:serine/threonine protein kinase/tetratricopeptide (TPR) repeat protein
VAIDHTGKIKSRFAGIFRQLRVLLSHWWVFPSPWITLMALDPKRVQAAFLAVVEHADADLRSAALDRECGTDEVLRRRVLALIAAHDQSAELPPVKPLPMDATTGLAAGNRAGAMIGGRYKLLEQIGEGGMGAVWVAEQTEPVRRRVALKLIKPGMDTKQVLSRFAAERQALALMDHPNIAKVFDGGMTDEGRPFFVMEYVKGVPITDYCDQARLSIEERLQLFLPICQAVQHAHQKGIIHRDLKPSNLLVCLYDGQAVPKVIDFGLAKATSQPLTEHTLYTAHGLMVGTPLYMSPEQAEFNNLDVDTRTDIYSLGVILYELLTGTTPLEKQRFKDAAFQEILRLIKEEEPPKPSTKLSGSASLPAIAAQRGLEPAQLSRTIRGELDWIVMKALEKERSRRYETANGLTRDLERYLHDEPVEACPPSLGYRASKFARRNMRVLVTASLFGFVVIAALVGVAGSVGWAVRDRQTREAVVERKILLALDKAEEAYGKDKLAETRAAVQQAESLLASTNTRPEVSSRVRQWVADLDMVNRLAQIHLEKSLALQEDHFDLTSARGPYRKAFEDYGLDLERMAPLDAGQKLKSSLIQRHLIAALDDWAIVADNDQRGQLLTLTQQVDSDAWRNRFRTALKIDDAETLLQLATDEACLAQHPATIAALAARLMLLPNRKPAQTLLRQALGRHPDDFWLNSHQGHLLLVDFQPDEAVAYLRLAAAKASTSAVVRNSLGAALTFTGKLTEAAEEYRAAIRLQPAFVMPHLNLGSIQMREGRFQEAEAQFQAAVRLRPEDGAAHAALAECVGAQKKYAEADKSFRRALSLDPDNWSINTDYLDMLEQAQLLAAAEREVESRLAENPNQALIHRLLGDIRWQIDNAPGAERAYREALRLAPQDAFGQTRLAAVLMGQDKNSEAVTALEEAVRLRPDFVWAKLYLGAALSRQSRWAEAEMPLREALRQIPDHFVVYILLTNCVRAQGKSGAEMPRRTVSALTNVGTTPFGRPRTSVKTYFELGAFELSSPIRTRDRVLVPRGAFGPPPTSRVARAWEEQTRQLRAAIQSNPRDITAREKLGELLVQNDLSSLYTAMWEAICIEPTNAKFHGYLGASIRNPSLAEAALRESIRLDPTWAFSHYRLAGALYLQGRIDEAVPAAREAVERDDKTADHQGMLARCLMKQGNWAEAERHYREELRLRPQNPASHNDLGWVLFRQGKKVEAEAEFQLARQQSKGVANSPFASHASAGLRYAASGQFWQATQHFLAAVVENPADDVSAVRAALLQLYEGDRSAYEATCKQMLEQCTRTTDGHTQRRTVHACLIATPFVGDMAQHRSLLGVAIREKQDQRMLLYVRGLFAYRDGQWAEAIKWCRLGREENRRTQATQLLDAHDLMIEAMALHQLGKGGEARNAYEQAVQFAGTIYLFAPHSLGGSWVDWLSYELNRREAAELLGIVDNSDWPRSPARALNLAAEGDWKAAATEMARACTSPAASSLDFIAAGTLLARAGDEDTFRRHCQAMSERFVATQNWQEIERTVKVCALAPFGIKISDELIVAVSKDIEEGKQEGWLMAWGNTARAMAAYRRGEIENAANWAEAAASELNSNRHARIQAFLIAAMAQYRLGNVNAAKDRLLTATEFRVQLPLPKLADGSLDLRLIMLESTAWWDILGIELMLSEASQLIDSKAAPLVPTDSSFGKKP